MKPPAISNKRNNYDTKRYVKLRTTHAIRIHVTGFRFCYNISAPLSVHHLLRVLAGEALRRFRAAQGHPELAGDQGQARAVARISYIRLC